jgi:uracil-DNA glycosylase family 4
MKNRHFRVWDELNRGVTSCRRCPRLVTYLQQTAPRASYRGQTYHAAPVPNFGDPQARILLVGLAPGAHGANRTGRMFTGDRSGDFLFASLHRVGLASQATSTHRDDGLTLRGVAITAACHCAPPANKPSVDELGQCRPWLEQTLAALPDLRVAVALGRIGFDAIVRFCRDRGGRFDPRPRFAHSASCNAHDMNASPRELVVLACYHPSQQNTFTGKLTPAMMDTVFRAAAREAGF